MDDKSIKIRNCIRLSTLIDIPYERWNDLFGNDPVTIFIEEGDNIPAKMVCPSTKTAPKFVLIPNDSAIMAYIGYIIGASDNSESSIVVRYFTNNDNDITSEMTEFFNSQIIEDGSFEIVGIAAASKPDSRKTRTSSKKKVETETEAPVLVEDAASPLMPRSLDEMPEKAPKEKPVHRPSKTTTKASKTKDVPAPVSKKEKKVVGALHNSSAQAIKQDVTSLYDIFKSSGIDEDIASAKRKNREIYTAIKESVIESSESISFEIRLRMHVQDLGLSEQLYNKLLPYYDDMVRFSKK